MSVCRASAKRELSRAKRLVERVEATIKNRASRLHTRQQAARERMLARHMEAERRLAAKLTSAERRKSPRMQKLRSRHAEQLRDLDARHRKALRDLPRAVECRLLGSARRAAQVVRAGCEDLCSLNLAGGVGGDKTIVALPSTHGTPRTLPARFVLVSAEKLVPSHDPISFAPRPDYPDATQERRYERDVGEQLKVVRIAQNMQPGLIANTNAGAVDGTPIATPDGIVLSGNGRTMGTQRHYRSGRRELAEYLARHVGQFGIDPAAVSKIADPIVVRVLDVGAGDRARLVRDFNVGLTQAMSADVEAAALARQLPSDVPKILRDGDADKGLSAYLTSRASLPLVGALERSGFINGANRTRLLGADGLLTAEARDDLGRMLSAAVLPTAIAERSAELARAVERSAVAWLVAAGAGPDWDVRPDLAAAALDLLSLRGSQMCMARWRQQIGLERRQTEGRPLAELLLEVLDLAAARPAVFAKIAGRFAESSRAGGGLFGGADPLAALRDAAADAGVVAARAGSTRRCRK